MLVLIQTLRKLDYGRLKNVASAREIRVSRLRFPTADSLRLAIIDDVVDEKLRSAPDGTASETGLDYGKVGG